MTFWSNDKIINFINFIRYRPVIWDINSHIYKDRNARKSAWRDVTHKFNISLDDAQKKFKNLRTYFQNEKRKLKARQQRSGNAYRPESMWFAFKQMDAFLSNDLAAEADCWADRDNDTERNQQCKISEIESNTTVCEPDYADHSIIGIDMISHPRSRPKTCKSVRLRKVQTQRDVQFQNTNAANEAYDPRNDQRTFCQLEDSNNCKSETDNNDIVSNDSSSPPPPKVSKKTKKRKIQSKKRKRLQNVRATANESARRSHSAFGDHIVQKLETYNRFVRNQVEFKISQILFEADMGHFDEPTRSEYSSRLQTATSVLPMHALIPEIGEENDEKPLVFADDTNF